MTLKNENPIEIVERDKQKPNGFAAFKIPVRQSWKHGIFRSVIEDGENP
jgi:hypothetical protein